MGQKQINPQEASVHSILSEIKEGKLDPSVLSKDIRQLCIETLLLDGQPPSSLAQLFKVSDKTIHRDADEIRKKNALLPTVNFAKEMIGEFWQKVRVHEAHLMRLSRAKDSSIGEKAQAEFLAFRVMKEAIQIFQTLGYAPCKPTEFVAELFHHDVSDSGFDDIRKKIDEFEAIKKETGAFPKEIEEKIEKLKLRIDKTELEKELEELKKSREEESSADEDPK
jgi:hypothetical protein